MRRTRLALLALSAASCALVACGAAELPPPPAPAFVVLPAPPPPAPPAAPPPLLVIPGAEASPRRVAEVNAPDVVELRAEGKRHALQRTADGLVAISVDRGVLGFVKSPVPAAPIRWAGLIEDDAILVAAGDTLQRAATPDDAVAGKLTALDKLDVAATLLASAGKIVVAAVPGPGGAYYESRDGGAHFKAAKRPGKGAMVDLTVRSDGVIVAAIETERVKNAQGKEGVRAQLFTARSAGAWTAGPLADSFYGSLLTHHGDSIVALSPKKKSSDTHDTLGLDAKGRWIQADYPEPWLSLAWTDSRVDIDAPTERPGFPAPATGNLGAIGGLMGRESIECRGVACLGRRAVLGSPPRARAFHDGVCAKEHVTPHVETIPGFDPSGKGAPDETYTTYECDRGAPAQRAATLLVRDGAERRVARLPITCASGEITGSDRASFVYCRSEHRGRPSILHVAPTGALTEVASGIAGDLDLVGAESASDGTTVIYAGEATWLCAVAGAPRCVAVPHDHYLAARPLPGGRALVARSSGDHELQIELVGEPGALPLRIAVNDNVLEIETTAQGNVRLWTSRTLTGLSMHRGGGEPPIDAFLVRADGQLVPDPAAKEAWLRDLVAARAPR